MDSLEYSVDANNILDEFYGVDKILYVEGLDDKVFWGVLFEKYYAQNIEIIDVNGIENLKPYIKQIESNQLTNSYVACDQDYNFIKNKVWNDNIICTYGHSIENSLVLTESVVDLVRSYAKFHKKDIIKSKFEVWNSSFKSKIGDLIYCDIYNEKNKLGFSIIGNNCDRYFSSRNSSDISSENVYNHLSTFFDDKKLKSIKDEFHLNSSNILDNFIRGHFLFSAIMRFTTILSTQLSLKKISITKESFFASMLISFEKNLSMHPHSTYYEEQIKSLS
ncbi:DUF4435 domain-containing protein [Acinetobacter guillouiae]|uniref:DUF4435 domain-containing protein n=1 Tax=Acinetobacter guillouiae TaxID=106649 RepID=A0A8X8GJ13_ACIGI|nr:DUF4435 domain-containing protein [Acinetobacter guillouiae]MCF0265998.1 DUF4435 domain-containing protein [Acinetobacter guillouiae]